MTERSERKALIIGSGGREHAIGAALDPGIEVYFSPGNAGTDAMHNGKNVSIEKNSEVQFAKDNAIDLTIIGPEVPLVAGLASDFREAGLSVFGPDKQAAQLEASKAYASEFMARHNIAQPASYVVHSTQEFEDLYSDPLAIVLKADGLAGGKGVVLPSTWGEATSTLDAMFAGGYDGSAENGVVIQERLSGPEISAFAVTDGKDYVLLPYAQDHKRLLDGDKGPNTGGMGAYAPIPSSLITTRQDQKINEIIRKTLDGMSDEGTPYKGVLYVSVMLAEQRNDDPVVIEYNVRFGDPETQVIMELLKREGVDVYNLLKSTDTKLDLSLYDPTAFVGKHALTICLAAKGYPDSPVKGDEIFGLDGLYSPAVTLQHGGTRQDINGAVLSNGGRVMYVTGTGESVAEAAAAAKSAIGDNGVHFNEMHYRTDIGKFALTQPSV